MPRLEMLLLKRAVRTKQVDVGGVSVYSRRKRAFHPYCLFYIVQTSELKKTRKVTNKKVQR